MATRGIINEYTESLGHGKVMVNYRAKAGARALSAYVRKCTIEVGVFYEVIRNFVGFGVTVWDGGFGDG